jgi:hypothetical protein
MLEMLVWDGAKDSLQGKNCMKSLPKFFGGPKIVFLPFKKF